MDEPEVTVIICTRNRRAWLAEALASVEAQIGIGSETVVVDDASTDDTWAYLDSHRSAALRVFRHAVRVPRAVVANVGLSHATGKFVMFLDDDDLLRPRALVTLAQALRGAPTAVAAVGARWDWFCDGRGGGRRDSHPWWPARKDVMDDLLFGWSAVSGQNLYRTAVVRKVGGYSESPDLWPCDDRDLWLRVARIGPVILRPEVVMTYRVHPGQSRPSNLVEIRERVARRAIRQLPRVSWRHGLGLRRSSALVDSAESALSNGRWLAGGRLAARACRAAPWAWFSPLIGPWVARRLMRRIWHRCHESWVVKRPPEEHCQ